MMDYGKTLQRCAVLIAHVNNSEYKTFYLVIHDKMIMTVPKKLRIKTDTILCEFTAADVKAGFTSSRWDALQANLILMEGLFNENSGK